MVKAGMEPRNITYQALIDHLVTLEAIDTTSSPNKEGALGGNDKHVKSKEENPGKGKTSYKNKNGNPKEEISKECDICKLLSQNQTPTKPTTIQNIKVGILFKKVWLW